jgi:hypothetical protein
MAVKRLYATTDLAEAEILRALLRDEGIESTLDNEGGAALAVGLPSAAVPIGINVSDADAPAAAEALARHFEKKDAEDMEADPEAPPPLTPEESASFQAKAGRRSFSRRFLILLFFFMPAIVGMALTFGEPWHAAVAATAGVLSIVALIWVVDLIAENRTGPSPTSGDGPAEKSSGTT